MSNATSLDKLAHRKTNSWNLSPLHQSPLPLSPRSLNDARSTAGHVASNDTAPSTPAPRCSKPSGIWDDVRVESSVAQHGVELPRFDLPSDDAIENQNGRKGRCVLSCNREKSGASTCHENEQSELLPKSILSNRGAALVADQTLDETPYTKDSLPKLPCPPSQWRALVGGTLGIYSAYLVYSIVQEDLFRYHSPIGHVPFTYVWTLQALESFVTIAVTCLLRRILAALYPERKQSSAREPLLPTNNAVQSESHTAAADATCVSGWSRWYLYQIGLTQLASKALTSLSLTAGLSFPVMALARSAKIGPVMMGQWCMGGSQYTLRNVLFGGGMIVGTALVSVGEQHHPHPAVAATRTTTSMGLVLVVLSLVADGCTAGVQKRLLGTSNGSSVPTASATATSELGSSVPTMYDFLYYSHLAQVIVAVTIAIATDEVRPAVAYMVTNSPVVGWYIGLVCLCSALGQWAIFYVIARFDPLVCTTITTTRKMCTILVSIGLKGHVLTSTGQWGLGLACMALLMEIEGKASAAYRRSAKAKASNT